MRFIQNRYGFLEESIQIRQPNQYITKYGVRMGDELVLAPLSFFYPDMYGLTGSQLTRVQKRFDGDPADPHDDFYLRQVQRGQDPVSSSLISLLEQKFIIRPATCQHFQNSSLKPLSQLHSNFIQKLLRMGVGKFLLRP